MDSCFALSKLECIIYLFANSATVDLELFCSKMAVVHLYTEITKGSAIAASVPDTAIHEYCHGHHCGSCPNTSDYRRRLCCWAGTYPNRMGTALCKHLPFTVTWRICFFCTSASDLQSLLILQWNTMHFDYVACWKFNLFFFRTWFVYLLIIW